MRPSIVVDADSHILEPVDLWENYMENRELLPLAPKFYNDENGDQQVSLEGYIPPRKSGMGMGGRNVDKKWGQEIKNQRWEEQQPGGFAPEPRIQDMDREGVDIAMLYPTVGLRYTGVKSTELAAALCRAYNNWQADYIKQFPQRLIGIGAVPFQEPELAVKEMHYVVEKLGFKGVFTRPNPLRGRNLDHPDYDIIWQTAQELNCPIGIHEGGFMPTIPAVGADRFDNFVYRHMASHPMEQQLSCMCLIFGGVLERFPGVKVVFLESGGGWLPYWLERMDEHHGRMGWMISNCKLSPSEYFRRQCLIQVPSEEKSLAMVTELIGEDHICWGTDYPHFDCNWSGAVNWMRQSDLPATAIPKILGENAIRFFNLDVSSFTTVKQHAAVLA
jgi:predicted TIM-barrel fold metal-dependent hydrolase